MLASASLQHCCFQNACCFSYNLRRSQHRRYCILVCFMIPGKPIVSSAGQSRGATSHHVAQGSGDKAKDILHLGIDKW